MNYRTLGLVFLIIFVIIECKAQSIISDVELDHEFDRASGISITNPSPKKIENLALLCKSWGYLKYYHPEISNGRYNWDYELFRILPKVLACNNSKELDGCLSRWIDRLGNIELSQPELIDSSTIKMFPDFSWIKESKFSEDLNKKLNIIRLAKKGEKQYYVSIENFPAPIFQNENPYSSMIFPDVGFRLLALFRYWNIIQYYYPYKYLIDFDWDNILSEYIPVFVESKNELEYHLAILSLITKISDTHATFQSMALEENFKGKYVLPVEITFIENKAVVTGLLNHWKIDPKIQIGDIIEEINGKEVAQLIMEKLPYTPASNDASKLRELAWDLLRSNDSVYTININRNSNFVEAGIVGILHDNFNAYERVVNQDTCLKKVANEILYLNPWTYKEKYASNIIKEIRESKGIIVDLRYPFTDPPYLLVNYLLSEPTIFAKITKGSLEHPGLFSYFKEMEIGEINDHPYNGKIVILNNEFTQSSAEFTTMAFRSIPNSIIIGSTTSGADGAVSKFSLPGGIHTFITGSGVYYPNGAETQRIGIIPDILVKPTISGIKDGRDELIEKAIEIINGK